MRLFEHPDFEQVILRAVEYFRTRGLRPAIIGKDCYVIRAETARIGVRIVDKPGNIQGCTGVKLADAADGPAANHPVEWPRPSAKPFFGAKRQFVSRSNYDSMPDIILTQPLGIPRVVVIRQHRGQFQV